MREHIKATTGEKFDPSVTACVDKKLYRISYNGRVWDAVRLLPSCPSMSDYFNSPGALLAVAFPPNRGLGGACTRLADLSRFAYRTPRLMTLREAARLICRRNMETVTHGHGNRAARREAQAWAARMTSRCNTLTAADVDKLAERFSESRAFPVRHTNFHE